MKFIDTLKNKHKYNNYSGLPFEMQLSKAIKQGQNRLRLLNPLYSSWKTKTMPSESDTLLNQKPNKQTNHE